MLREAGEPAVTVPELDEMLSHPLPFEMRASAFQFTVPEELVAISIRRKTAGSPTVALRLIDPGMRDRLGGVRACGYESVRLARKVASVSRAKAAAISNVSGCSVR